jgi:hypothetical protein
MAKYLQHFPQPFLDDLLRNRCVPFLGAGLSRNAELPGGRSMPDWDALGKECAKAIPGYEYAGTLDAISAFCHEFSRATFVERLGESLTVRDARPGKVHRAFCELPFELVCTTNFEFLIERGYDAVGRYCCPIIDEDQLSTTSRSMNSVILLKIHGDLHHPSRIIATEEDYDGFIDKYPLLATYLANLLIGQTALFVGYSLDDPDFRTIWQVVGERLGRLRRLAYTIAVNASPQSVARFERRGVRVINLPGKTSEYPTILQTVFKELKDYWLGNVLRLSTVTKDDVLAQLSLPQGAENRLCFLALPFQLLSFYKSEVFPIIEQYGFTPLTAEEVLAPGDAVVPKVLAMIGRAEVVLADIASPNVMFELGYFVQKRRKQQKLVLITDDLNSIPSDLQSHRVIRRPKNVQVECEAFLQEISQAFHSLSQETKQSIEEQPKSLLASHFNSAAIVSVFTLLETTARSYLERHNLVTGIASSFIRSLDRLVEMQAIDANVAAEVRSWYQLRNAIVHGVAHAGITNCQAAEIVNGVYLLVENLSR